MGDDDVMRSRQPFTATYEGERYRFQAVEHFNIGDGWYCRELDGRLPLGVYASTQLTDVSALTS